MIKTWLIDDDMIFRTYIKELVDWKELGYVIVSEFEDPYDVLNDKNAIIPDVVLIDIDLPRMNGLKLTEKLKSLYPEIIVMIISGHNKFDFAREAIRLDVDDYLLKPFNKDELIHALSVIKAKTFSKRRIADSRKISGGTRRDIVLNLILEGSNLVDYKAVSFHKRDLGIDLLKNYFCVASVDFTDFQKRFDSAHKLALFQEFAIDEINKLLEFMSKKIVFSGPKNHIVIIVGFDAYTDYKEFDNGIFEKIHYSLKSKYQIENTIGIGNLVEGYAMLSVSYNKSVDAARHRGIISDMSKVIFFEDVKNYIQNCGFYSGELNTKLLRLLRLADISGIKSTIEEIVRYMDDEKLSLAYRQTMLLGLRTIYLSYIAETKQCIYNVMGDDFQPLVELKNSDVYELANKIVIEYTAVCNYYTGVKTSRAAHISEMSRLYIDDHYNDPELNLKKISNNLFLSPDYIRKVFKNEIGVTMSEYIISLRMERAKELINSGKNSFAQIASEVGFYDASYFSRSFKRYFGVTPTEYSNISNQS